MTRAQAWVFFGLAYPKGDLVRKSSAEPQPWTGSLLSGGKFIFAGEFKTNQARIRPGVPAPLCHKPVALSLKLWEYHG